MHPRDHRSHRLPSLVTGESACATLPPAGTAEPPAAMANALEGPGHHLDPSIMIAVAWGSLSPPQLDTSAAKEAHQRAQPREKLGRLPSSAIYAYTRCT